MRSADRSGIGKISRRKRRSLGTGGARKDRATGRLEDPVIGRIGGAWLRDFAREHDLDLSRSAAYGGTDSDVPLLSSVGLPCAVHPDRGLRAAAVDLRWPIVEATA